MPIMLALAVLIKKKSAKITLVFLSYAAKFYSCTIDDGLEKGQQLWGKTVCTD